MPSDLFTTSYLGSFTGLVAVTFLLVQFFKEPNRQHLSDWWIRLLAVGIALAIQSFTLYVAGNFTVEAVGLAVLNSFLVAITAAGAHNISQSSSTNSNDNSNYFLPIQGTAISQVPDISPPIIKNYMNMPTESTPKEPPIPPPTKLIREGQLPDKADPSV